MDLLFKRCQSYEEFLQVINTGFDEPLWGDIDDRWGFGSYSHNIYYFYDLENIYGMVETYQDADGIEMLTLEVPEKFRDCGYGKEIIRILKDCIIKNTNCFGYSIASGRHFWKSISSWYDKEVFTFLDNNEECGYLMRFEL